MIFVLPANYHLRWFAFWPAKTVQKDRPTLAIVVQNQFDCLPIRILCQQHGVLRVAHTTSSQVHKSAGIPLEGGGELGPKHNTQSPRPSDGPSAFRYVADTVPSPSEISSIANLHLPPSASTSTTKGTLTLPTAHQHPNILRPRLLTGFSIGFTISSPRTKSGLSPSLTS